MQGGAMIQLTDNEFHEISTFMKINYGIDLMKKRQLIESRMYSVLLKKGFKNYTDYFNLIKSKNEDEISMLLNKLTTNHTYFLREMHHFDFLKDTFLPNQEKTNFEKNIRIWSAGCSSGEEAYTTIMTIKDYFGMKQNLWDYRILATDISTKVLETAKNPTYFKENLKDVPPDWMGKYFVKKADETYSLQADVLNQVIFKTFNLMDKMVNQKPFDLIFCRNVMIYFDNETKNKLVNKFYDLLKPQGYLFIGHSETIKHGDSNFKYIQPSIYQKG